jgi:hypothetical protein
MQATFRPCSVKASEKGADHEPGGLRRRVLPVGIARWHATHRWDSTSTSTTTVSGRTAHLSSTLQMVMAAVRALREKLAVARG